MDEIKFNLAEECRKVVAEVVKKYKYDAELEKVLTRLATTMLEQSSYEDRKLFYRMLMSTPILIIPEGCGMTHKEIANSILGNFNNHIDILDHDEDAYEKLAGDAAFISRPYFDEDAQVRGVIKFLYVKATFDVERLLSEELTESQDVLARNKLLLYKTPLNLTQLAHELGHAWNSEDTPYKREGDILIERVGTGTIYYQIARGENGRFTMKEIRREGMLTEEALNTGMELASIAKYCGITKDELENLYNKNVLVPSSYQGEMTRICQMLSNSELGQDVKEWRLRGSKEATDKLNRLMGKSPIYVNRNTDREDELEVAQIFGAPEEYGVTEFCEQNKRDFFPDKEFMTPLQLFNIAIAQCFDVSSYRTSGKEISDEMFNKLIGPAITTARGLVEDTLRALEEEKNNEKDDKNITE